MVQYTTIISQYLFKKITQRTSSVRVAKNSQWRCQGKIDWILELLKYFKIHISNGPIYPLISQYLLKKRTQTNIESQSGKAPKMEMSGGN